MSTLASYRKNWSDPPIPYMKEILTRAKCVLFDFDISVCDVYKTLNADEIAEKEKDYLNRWGLMKDEWLEEDDPLKLYRHFSKYWKMGHSDKVVYLETFLTTYECLAVRRENTTPFVEDLVKALVTAEKTVAITTNNSVVAVKDFFFAEEFPELGEYFRENVFGRRGPNPELLKPHPNCLQEAMFFTGFEPHEYLMIGDSVSDFLAAQSVGVPFLGYTRTFKQCVALLKAGATNVVRSYDPLLKALDVDLYEGEGRYVVKKVPKPVIRLQ
jgi:phosphoglycolate phosphatase-like HAD superfamily hydrolase